MPSDPAISPDMMWYSCTDCDRDFTLADIDGNRCPHCGSIAWVPYSEGDDD